VAILYEIGDTMLCDECKNRTFKTLDEAKKCGRELKINNRGHQVDIGGEQMWRPGFNPIELQGWCSKNCEGLRIKNLLKKPKLVIKKEVNEDKKKD